MGKLLTPFKTEF